MTFPSPNKGAGRQCPPPPPSSPADSRRRRSSGMETDHPQQYQQRHQQHQQPPPPPPPQQRIANLLQYAQTSYTTNPTDALSALMDALTVSTGTDAAAQVAMDRIRSELGDTVADCVSRNASNRHNPNSSQQQQQQQQSAQQHSYESAGQLSEREMTLRAMEVVQRMLDDTSTILHAQGRQHLLQQAMEDGSSVVCSMCGDMVARDRWRQHAEYWCRVIEEEKSCDGGEDMAMDD